MKATPLIFAIVLGSTLLGCSSEPSGILGGWSGMLEKADRIESLTGAFDLCIGDDHGISVSPLHGGQSLGWRWEDDGSMDNEGHIVWSYELKGDELRLGTRPAVFHRDDTFDCDWQASSSE